MTTSRRLVVLGLAGVLITAACSSDDDAQTTGSEAPVATAEQPVVEPPAETVPELQPTSTAEPEPSDTEPEPADTVAATERDFSAIGPIVESFVAEKGLNGAGLIVVHRDDGVLYHDHWGEFSEDRISLVASSSKMITAGVLLRLQDDGLLDVDAPVADAVEWGAGNPDITPAQLVSNSSGLVGLGPDPGYGPYVCQFLPDGTLQECAEQIFTTPDDDSDIAAADTEFRYGGAQWQVAGAVAEAVSGRSWAELVDEIYVQPCGLETLAYNNHFVQIGAGGFTYPTPFDSDPGTLMPTDNPNMEGGAYVTTGDYGKLLLMHLRGGVCGDVQVLSQDALDTLHGDRVGEVYDGDAFSEDVGYGMGWWVDRESGRIYDPGAYGSYPWLDLDDGYGAFLVIEADSGTGAELAGQLFDVVEAAVVG